MEVECSICKQKSDNIYAIKCPSHKGANQGTFRMTCGECVNDVLTWFYTDKPQMVKMMAKTTKELEKEDRDYLMPCK